MTAPNETKIINLPNALSATRLVLGPIAFFLIVDGRWLAVALVVMIIAELTDMCDGYLARSLNQTTLLGKILDPFADSFYRMCVFVALFAAGYMHLAILSVFVWRDLGVAFVRVFAQENGLTLAARWSGKLKAVIQGIAQIGAIGAVLLWGRDQPATNLTIAILIGLAALITLYSLFDYIAGTRTAVRAAAPPNGQPDTTGKPPLLAGVYLLAAALSVFSISLFGGTAAWFVFVILAVAFGAGIFRIFQTRQTTRPPSGATSASLSILVVTMAATATLLGAAPGWLVLALFAHEIALPYLNTFLRQNGASDLFTPRPGNLFLASLALLLLFAFAASQFVPSQFFLPILAFTVLVSLITAWSLVWNCTKTSQALALSRSGASTTSG
ncbi:MAG: hypothetical protein GXP01_01390 [Alphaproteobacteria bacterium]|nr:hypothetical protein [Alphaproteobacteria bacterium]